MSLTVKDILEKTFKRSFKGYDENEVDKFLDEIIDEMKALQNDNAALKEALESETGRAKKTKETEEAIMHTLVSAQKSAERILAEAAKKAEVIIDSAEATAKKRAESTVKELGDAQRKLEELKNSAKVLSKRFNDLINGEAASFEKVYRTHFGDIEGGINVKALEKIDEDITESLKGIQEPERQAEARRPAAERPAPNPAADWSAPKPAVERPAPKPAADWSAPKPDADWSAPKPAVERPAPKQAADWSAPKPDADWSAPKPAADWSTPKPDADWSAPKQAADWSTPKPDADWSAPKPAAEWSAPKQAADWSAPKPTMEELISQPITDNSEPAPMAKEPMEEEPVTEFVNANEYDFELGNGKLMELTEINKVLSEIENSGEDILQEDYTSELSETSKRKEKRPNAYNSIYDDYSWLYGNEEKEEPETSEPGVVFKDPKEKEELESLIDDIIDNKGI